MEMEAPAVVRSMVSVAPKVAVVEAMEVVDEDEYKIVDIISIEQRFGWNDRWLVRWQACKKSYTNFEPRVKIPADMLEVFEQKRMAIFNTELEPLLAGSSAPSGVVGLTVSESDALEGKTMQCGHYYSFVKTTGVHWHKCDDDRVAKVRVDEVLAAKAYLLFYKRVETPTTARGKRRGLDGANVERRHAERKPRPAGARGNGRDGTCALRHAQCPRHAHGARSAPAQRGTPLRGGIESAGHEMDEGAAEDMVVEEEQPEDEDENEDVEGREFENEGEGEDEDVGEDVGEGEGEGDTMQDEPKDPDMVENLNCDLVRLYAARMTTLRGSQNGASGQLARDSACGSIDRNCSRPRARNHPE